MAEAINVRDKHIIAKSFRMMCSGVDNMTVLQHLNWSSYYDFFSTSVGDNRYINPLPQFSPATDHRPTKFIQSKEGSLGYQFKKVFDDNFTLLTLTAGTCEFTGILDFVTTMFNPVSAIIANKGRSPSWAFYYASALGSIAFWPMQLFSIGMSFLSFLTDSNSNQFWTVKPTMGLLLASSQSLFNDLLTNLGVIRPVLPNSGKGDIAPLYGNSGPVDNIEDQTARLAKLFPNAVNSDGTIDLAVLISKGTRKYRFVLDKLAELDNRGFSDTNEKLNAMADVVENSKLDNRVADRGGTTSDFVTLEQESTGKYRTGGKDDEAAYSERKSAFLKKSAYENISDADAEASNRARSSTAGGDAQLSTEGAATVGNPGGDVPQTATVPKGMSGSDTLEKLYEAQQQQYQGYDPDKSWQGKVKDLVQTAWYGGFDAITFRVAHEGAVSDSFSNSATRSGMADMFNSQVKSVNNLKFDLAGGTTGIGIVDKIVDGAKDIFMGLAAGMTIANIPMALMGNSFINIPEHWESSSANLHKETYTLKFKATYATLYSQITNIWVPFSILAAMSLPNSAGASAQTTPFMVKAFCQSRQIIRNGMIGNISFRFGDGPAGWTKSRHPLNMTVELDIYDMDPAVSIPTTRSLGLADLTNPAAFAATVLTDTGKYNDWISRLTGVEYLDTVLKWSRLNRRLTSAKADLDYNGLSAISIANTVNDSIISDIGKLPFRPMRR